jgi:hypothetical protein
VDDVGNVWTVVTERKREPDENDQERDEEETEEDEERQRDVPPPVKRAPDPR